MRALENVDFRVEPGEIHALMGENGAGKSTLIKIMTGASSCDRGEIRLDGRAVEIASPSRRSRVGHRRRLSGSQSGADDVGDQEPDARSSAAPVRTDFLASRRASSPASGSNGSASISMSSDRSVPIPSRSNNSWRSRERSRTTLAFSCSTNRPRASMRREIDAPLPDPARSQIARDRHRIHHPFHRAGLRDRRPNLRAAKWPSGRRSPTAELAAAEADPADARARTPASRTASASDRAPRRAASRSWLAEGLGRRRTMAAVRSVDRAPDEVVGLAGLLGSGRTEVAKLIFGAMRPDSGRSRVDGARIARHLARRSLDHGHGFLSRGPEGRRHIRRTEHPREHRPRTADQTGWLRRLSRAEQERLAREMIKAHGIATSDAEKPVAELSGGQSAEGRCSRDRWCRGRAFSSSTSPRAASTSARTPRS